MKAALVLTFAFCLLAAVAASAAPANECQPADPTAPVGFFSDTECSAPALEPEPEVDAVPTIPAEGGETYRAAAARPCNAQEFSTATMHCNSNNAPWWGSCRMVGCMVEGNLIIYSWSGYYFTWGSAV